jgi:hypothetical protein
VFGTNHYFPILRWKQAEMNALHRVRVNDKARMTPIIEITPASFSPKNGNKAAEDSSTTPPLVAADLTPDPGSVLRRHAKEVLRFWGNSPFLLELGHLEGAIPLINGRSHPLAYFADIARSYRLNPVPVTTLNRSVEYKSAVANCMRTGANGVCIRLSPSDLLDVSFVRHLGDAQDELGTSPAVTDLLIDYGVFDPEAPEIAKLLSNLPHRKDWRSLIVARGAFPKDLQGFELGARRIPRSDWTTWVGGMRGSGRLRWPSFSDYTIQFGQYVEPPENANPSASIRYTLAEQWLIMRGEGIKNKGGPGGAQWNAHATLLVDGDDFYGSDFSNGDEYISTMSRNQKTHGNAMTWIRAGLNHHMSVVSRQIAAL